MLQQYQHILVAIDGSYEAELAFKKAVAVAKRNDAELILIHIVDTRAFQNVSSFDSAMVEQVTEKAMWIKPRRQDWTRSVSVLSMALRRRSSPVISLRLRISTLL